MLNRPRRPAYEDYDDTDPTEYLRQRLHGHIRGDTETPSVGDIEWYRMDDTETQRRENDTETQGA